MRQGKNPTRNQRKFMEKHGVDTEKNLVVTDGPKEFVYMDRKTGKQTIITK